MKELVTCNQIDGLGTVQSAAHFVLADDGSLVISVTTSADYAAHSVTVRAIDVARLIGALAPALDKAEEIANPQPAGDGYTAGDDAAHQ